MYEMRLSHNSSNFLANGFFMASFSFVDRMDSRAIFAFNWLRDFGMDTGFCGVKLDIGFCGVRRTVFEHSTLSFITALYASLYAVSASFFVL